MDYHYALVLGSPEAIANARVRDVVPPRQPRLGQSSNQAAPFQSQRTRNKYWEMLSPRVFLPCANRCRLGQSDEPSPVTHTPGRQSRPSRGYLRSAHLWEPTLRSSLAVGAGT